ncbi:MAG TPA: P-loop NTPase fold protein [Longimicrobium sp.]|nr:P-loop NTPase fold protein [Longimicrobium sp.]
MDKLLKILGSMAAVGVALLAASRSLLFGSAKAAQTYLDLRSDPLGPVVRLFQKLVSGVKRPVAVFVDDLDRCDGAYVVELLEGIQTLFRSAPVAYVVAADRKWICSSFEKHYADFGGAIGEAGRPLGYLFLDKLFQVSAAVPRPPRDLQASYWAGLLRAAGSADPEAVETARKTAEAEAEEKMRGAATQEELETHIEAEPDPVRRQAARNVAARLITAPEAQRATEHRLKRFAPLLEPNPRAMKRLVNAFGMHQAAHLIEGRHVRPDALARWTIVELRWPLLADYLADHPDAVPAAGAPPLEGVSQPLAALLADPEVLRVVRGDATAGSGALDEESVRRIVGDLADPGAPSAEPSKSLPASVVQSIQPSPAAEPSV